MVTRIDSIRLLSVDTDGDLLHLLTIEGENYSIKLQTGQILFAGKSDFLRNWRNADLKGVKGLSQRAIYALKFRCYQST
jgi:hypothetical protein